MHGNILGLVPYDLRSPSLGKIRRTLWNTDEERFIVPTIFGAGWSVNLRSATQHPVQAGIIAALVIWSIRRSRRR
ncbi:MAG: hypothetical protein WA990_08080 [Rubrobacteraceae bacterium]